MIYKYNIYSYITQFPIFLKKDNLYLNDVININESIFHKKKLIVNKNLENKNLSLILLKKWEYINKLFFHYKVMKNRKTKLNLHIKITHNNTIANITNIKGKTHIILTAGAMGFKGPSRASYYVVHKLIHMIFRKALRKRLIFKKFLNLNKIYIIGTNRAAKAAIFKAIKQILGKRKSFSSVQPKDVYPLKLLKKLKLKKKREKKIFSEILPVPEEFKLKKKNKDGKF